MNFTFLGLGYRFYHFRSIDIRIEILDKLLSEESRIERTFTLEMFRAIMSELKTIADSIYDLYFTLFGVMENQVRIGVAKSEQDDRTQGIGKSLFRLSKTYDEMKKKIEEAYKKRMRYFRDHR